MSSDGEDIPRSCHITLTGRPKKLYGDYHEAYAAIPHGDFFMHVYRCELHAGWHMGHDFSRMRGAYEPEE